LKRNYLIAAGLVLVILISTLTLFSLSPQSVPDSVIIRPYGSLPEAIQGILAGQVDMLPITAISLGAMQPFENSTQVKLVNVPSYDFTYIGFNLRNAPLNDPKFRKAMLFAFNRPRMLNQSVGSFGRSLGPGLFSSAYSSAGWPTVNDQYSYDPAIAKSLLDGEGFNVTSSSPFRTDPSTNETLRLIPIISRLTQPQEVAAAASFAKDMQNVGLPIISLPESDVDFNAALKTYTFDIFVDSQTANNSPTWLYSLFDSKNDLYPVPLSTDLVGYSNSTYDKYAGQLLTSTRPDEIRTAAEKCQEILAADLPVIPLFSQDFLVAVNPRLPVNQVVGSVSETIRTSVISILQSPGASLPLRIGVTSDFGNLDPTLTSNQADWIAFGLLTEPLVSMNQQGNLKPALAERWAASADGTIVTITLRQNATFYNGQSITVDDVVGTVNWLTRNAKPSSALYAIMTGIKRADVLDQKTLRITLTQSDSFAVDAFTNLFALPANRLSNIPSEPDLALGQLLVSSGPLILHEFSRTNGISMLLNNLYFGKSWNFENVNAFQGDTMQGVQVSSGTLVTISSRPLIVDSQPVENASYNVCMYDQNGLQLECVTGSYTGQSTYAAAFPVDARFQQGTYWVESTMYGNLPSGNFIILEEKTLTVRSSPLFPLILLVLLIVGVGALVVRRMTRSSRGRPRRPRSVRKARPT